MACEKETREASVTATFAVCKEHGEARVESALLHSDGVDPMAVIDVILSVAEITATKVISEFPPLKLLVTSNYRGYELPERAQEHLVRIAANMFLQHKLETRDYESGEKAAVLEVPL